VSYNLNIWVHESSAGVKLVL